jgi:hypothetical protein
MPLIRVKELTHNRDVAVAVWSLWVDVKQRLMGSKPKPGVGGTGMVEAPETIGFLVERIQRPP